ncbi:MAG: hypothetical protein J6Q32_00870 [Clostridia bacterium]|nr:hypothetical protein [Clostridia bacterium]
MEESKSLKQYAKEAKQRLKTGFWQRYNKNLTEDIKKAQDNGVSISKVKEYYAERVLNDIKRGEDFEEEFYKKVKTLLDTEGEVSDALGRLTDKDYFNSLSYEEKQRYTLDLSEKYVRAIERYKKEKLVLVSENV